MQHHEEAWIYNGQEEVPPTVRRVRIAEGITKIPDYAFEEHQELEEIILSSSVQEIGEKAFCTCEKLKSILYQGREKEEVGIPSSVRVIDDQAFFRCMLLARLGLKEGLKQIGKGAFGCCKSLTEVEIPSTVKVIDDFAFFRCNSLARLALNEGLERIGKGAFVDCKSLSHVRIPQNVNSIATGAFIACISLISIELPEECSSFDIALSGCQSLVSLVAGPKSIFFRGRDQYREEFFQRSKLG
eukprot:scaffold3012_cov112-Cylindrotheca_fusiformis.AAC.2